MLASFVIALVVTSVIQGGPGQVIGVQKGPQSSQVQTAHALGLALYVYARDHDGKYPRGNSSTEVFQQLMDEGYVTDAGIFYSSVAGTGKIKGTTNKLKPENVCWDITDAVGPDDSDELPLIFPTGYKIDYVAGGKAHLLSNGWRDGISVFYKNNSAAFCVAQSGGVPIIDATFDPKGKTYRQLTPDGPLP